MLYYPQAVNFTSVEEAYLFTSPAAATRDTAVKHIALTTTNMVAQTFPCQWSELDLKSNYELKIKKNSYLNNSLTSSSELERSMLVNERTKTDAYKR